MNTAFPTTLLQLFDQVIDDTDSIPEVPVDDWQEGSIEHRLLTGFRKVMECIHHSKQEALKSEEAQYRGIFEASTDGIFIADLNGFPVEANPADCKMFGYSYASFIG